MKRIIILIIFIILAAIPFTLQTAASPKEKSANPILNSGDLPGYYFNKCTSEIGTWEIWSKDRIKSSKDEPSVNKFEVIYESWFSEPLDQVYKSGFKKPSERNGYFTVSVKRYILPSHEDALKWLKTAFRVNYFVVYSGDYFEEGSYTGEKIGDVCYLFRTDKTAAQTKSERKLAWERATKSNKTLYFVKNNTAVALYVHYVTGSEGDKEVPASFVENLAKTICSRL